MSRPVFYRFSTLRRLIILACALLVTDGLFAHPVVGDVGPEGEWVFTGPPATPTGALGTLITLQSGDALLIGKTVREYDPIPALGHWWGRYSETGVSRHW
jgi:hypothetical protein